MNDVNNCSKCGLFTKLATANKNRGIQFYRSWCVACEKLRKDTWRHANKEKHNQRSQKWAAQNKAKRREICSAYYHKTYEQQKLYHQKWRQENKHLVNISTSTRRKRLRQATPESSTEWDAFFIEQMYDIAMRRNLEVDHIIPLRNAYICGLHVPENLQLLSKSANASKSNSFESYEI